MTLSFDNQKIDIDILISGTWCLCARMKILTNVTHFWRKSSKY
jgi:hypothetical protein